MKQESYIKVSDFVKKFKYGEKTVKYINDIPTGIIYIAFVGMLIWLLVNRDERLIRVVLVTAISFVLVSAFRYFYNEKRPYTLYDFDPIVKKEKAGESMPSRHVFSGFIIGMAFLYVSPYLSIPIFVCAAIMAVARVIVGVHFPKDVIAGAALGLIMGYVGFYII